MEFSIYRQMLFLLIYGFLAWCVEAVYFAATRKQFVNRGLLTLPIDVEMGLVFANITVVLPTMGRNYLGMYLLTLGNLILVRAITGFFRSRITRRATWLYAAPSATAHNLVLQLVAAAGILLIYLLVQPIMILLESFLSDTVQRVIFVVAWVLILSDFVTVLIAVRKGSAAFEKRRVKGKTDEMSDAIARFVWRRLEKAYPGISDENQRSKLVFAKGMSLDKLVWVFLISALLGDIIETFYVRFDSGVWMSRSSVIIGPFSFVWGIGAVLLTIALMRFKDKNVLWILLVGGILGGVFEYMCSVFTEIVFGKIFWDYSHMPLNIGGRTNVAFMFCWGILGVVWVKIAYPPLEHLIEKFPPLAAKLTTWAVAVLMVFDALLTILVLNRYNTRQIRPEPANIVEQFIDETYDDEFVEHRWQNMKSS